MPPTPDSLLPPNELERLRTLRRYDIEQSLNEPVFDAFVNLATRLFRTPISLVALVEEDEVLYPGNQGLPGLAGQPRGEAICSVVVQQNKAVVITDLAINDPRLLTEAAYAAAWAKGLRFYAGAPVRMPDQRSIGTLCVIDRQPRSFSPAEQQALSQVAELMGQTIAVWHLCLSDPELGATRWQILRAVVQEQLEALVILVRYLSARDSTADNYLESTTARLNDLRRALADYRQQLDYRQQ